MGDWRRPVRAVIRSQPLNWALTAAARPFAGTAIPVEWLIKHLPRVGRIKAPLPNGSTLLMHSPGEDPIASRVSWLGWDADETETIRVFFTLAKTARNILDVGGFVGYYSLVGALANPEARIHVFEPVPELRRRIERNLALNRLSDRVTIVPAAVGAADGQARFYRGADEVPSCSSLSRDYAYNNCPTVRELDVTLVSLDAWVKASGLERIDLVKIDVESREPDVLRGMKGLLEKDSPDIVCEVLNSQDTAAALEAVLAPHGYRFFLLTADGPQPIEHIVAHPRWRNHLFSKRAVLPAMDRP